MHVEDLLERLHVVALPMRVRFRGITVREVALIDGPVGWGEFGAFVEYGPAEAARWLAAGIESAYRPRPSARRSRIPVNATVPAVTPAEVPGVLARFLSDSGTLADDVTVMRKSDSPRLALEAIRAAPLVRRGTR